MIDFATLQGLTIPEGVVTQIADAAGVVLWSANRPVILQVEKITADTYAAETTYTGEQFILLDIYPKTNGTVSVTYGGLTKTITDTSGAEEPNAQQVFFGTFNGVSDSVTTPASGELIIEGDYDNFASGAYSVDNKTSGFCTCIKSVVDWGNVTSIAANAFRNYESLTSFSFPDGVLSIGSRAFSGCTNLAITSLPSSITSIGASAFSGCTNLRLTSLPDSLTEIGMMAFMDCYSINIRNFPSKLTRIDSEAFRMGYTSKSKITTHPMYGATIVLPNTIQFILTYAFGTKCESTIGEYKYYTYLHGAKILATTPPQVDIDAFADSSYEKGFTFTVPKGCIDVYKADANWGTMLNRVGYYIVEES